MPGVDQPGRFQGVITALLTPFTRGGQEVDMGALKGLCEWQIKAGIHCLFPLGTTGEGLLLSPEERKRAAEAVVEQVAGRIPVILHVGHISTSVSCDLALHAAATGADAVAVIAPYFYPLDEEALVNHLVAVARSVPRLPVFLYNNPATAVNSISRRVFRRVSQACDNIMGLKDSSKSLEILAGFVEEREPGQVVLVGGDGLVYEALELGAAGCVSSLSGVFPWAMLDIYRLWQTGDKEGARSAQTRARALQQALQKGPYYASCKKILKWMGLPGGEVRPPMRDLTADEERMVLEALEGFQHVKRGGTHGTP
ncbi:4-hydroxy-tetrahydrodipicolinate synthase [Neomoorella glycerini]|uniref:4-hydroxy-tetrahydrodipicolinate synthase n=1 Tax=Neomoorella glycerini TaxID=55779 RepID=A0A6I5ZUA4_9FIRM|nr:dihydrodipicolinate synthase family protein [Moorella glycerini]QGP93117.1 4-hydroxy-tetrahydrodipicolinate synthase [Moorella glycerini]